MAGQLAYCTKMDRCFKIKKLKRKFFGFGTAPPAVNAANQGLGAEEEQEEDISRGSTGRRRSSVTVENSVKPILL